MSNDTMRVDKGWRLRLLEVTKDHRIEGKMLPELTKVPGWSRPVALAFTFSTYK